MNEKKQPDPKHVAEGYLNGVIPPGTPPIHRSISSARFRGRPGHRKVIAEVEMFDGLAATVEIFGLDYHIRGHQWLRLDGGPAFFEDGRWQRDG